MCPVKSLTLGLEMLCIIKQPETIARIVSFISMKEKKFRFENAFEYELLRSTSAYFVKINGSEAHGDIDKMHKEHISHNYKSFISITLQYE